MMGWRLDHDLRTDYSRRRFRMTSLGAYDDPRLKDAVMRLGISHDMQNPFFFLNWPGIIRASRQLLSRVAMNASRTVLRVVTLLLKVPNERRRVQQDLQGTVEEASVAHVVEACSDLVVCRPADTWTDRRKR